MGKETIMAYTAQTLYRIDCTFKRIFKNCSFCTTIWSNNVYCIYYIKYNGQTINCPIIIALTQVQGNLLQCAKALRIVNKLAQYFVNGHSQNGSAFNEVSKDLKQKVPSWANTYFNLECLK